jgi:hypothetical protein
MRKACLLAMVFLVVLAASPFTGASPAPAGCVLSGIVLNAQGTPVTGAQIFWQNSDGTKPRASKTDEYGRFRMTKLPAGLYDLRAEANGMWSDWAHNVPVRGGREARVTLQLARTAPPAR